MNLLQSLRLLGDGARSFAEKCIDGILPNSERIAALVSESLMLVTALNQKIGYDNAAKCAKKAHAEGKTLRDATIELGLLNGEEFDRTVRPELMLGTAEV